MTCAVKLDRLDGIPSIGGGFVENENLDVFDRAMLFLGQKTFGYKGIEAEFAVIHKGKAASAAEDAKIPE